MNVLSRAVLAGSFLFLASYSSVSRAALTIYTWNGSTSTWSDGGNWIGGVPANNGNSNSGSEATFGTVGSLSQPVLDVNQTVAFIQFTAAGWNLSAANSGDTLTVGRGVDAGTVTSGSNTISTNFTEGALGASLFFDTGGTSTLTISGNISAVGSGSGVFTFGTDQSSNAYTGTVVLSGDNSALNLSATSLSIQSGTLKVGSATALGLSTNNISGPTNAAIGSRGTLDLNGFSPTVGTVSGFETITNNGASPVVLHAAQQTVGTAAYTGSFTDGTGVLAVTFQGATGAIAALRGFSYNTGTTTVTSGELDLQSGTVAQTLAVATGTSGTNTLTFSTAPTGIAVGQQVSGTGIGSGALITAINTATNTVTLSANNTGTVSSVTFDADASLGSGQIVINGGILNLNRPNAASNNNSIALQSYTGTSPILVQGGMLTSGAVSANSAFINAGITMTSGSISPGNTGILGTANILSLTSGKNFNMSGGTLSFDLGTSAVTVFDQIASAGGGSSFSITGGTLALNLGTKFSYASTYQILNGFGTGSVSNLAITGYDTTDFTASLDNTGLLSFSAMSVPEPQISALFLGGIALLGLCLRFRVSGEGRISA